MTISNPSIPSTLLNLAFFPFRLSRSFVTWPLTIPLSSLSVMVILSQVS